MFYLVLIFFTARYGISQIVPRYHKSMKVIRKYVKLTELISMLENKEFSEIEFPEEIKQELSKSELKKLKKELLISNKWLYAEGVYIPKKMIVGFAISDMDCDQELSALSALNIYLANGRIHEFESFSRKNHRVAEYLNMGNEIENLRQIDNKDEVTKNFKTDIITKEQFLEFIGYGNFF